MTKTPKKHPAAETDSLFANLPETNGAAHDEPKPAPAADLTADPASDLADDAIIKVDGQEAAPDEAPPMAGPLKRNQRRARPAAARPDMKTARLDGDDAAPQEGPDVAPRLNVGTMLREARFERGEKIEAVAQELRIRRDYLEALEAGKYDALPAPAYVFGFLRSYGAWLGLDVPKLIMLYQREVAGVPRLPELAMPTPLGEGRLPGPRILTLAILGLIVAIGLWSWLGGGNDTSPVMAGDPPPFVTEATKPKSQPAPQPSAVAPIATLPTQSAEQAAQQQAAPQAQAPAQAPQPSQAVPAAAPDAPPPASGLHIGQPAQPQAQAQAQADARSAAAPAAAPARPQVDPRLVTLIATSDAWVQVTDRKGDVVVSKLLHKGEYTTVPRGQGLALTTGNAGGLVMEVDGQRSSALGLPTQVLRMMPLP